MFTFIHCSDLHLDSPLRGLAQLPGAPVKDIQSASRRALDNLVYLARQHQVSFVVIAGDIYDGDWPDYHTGLYFNDRMAQLGAAGIRVFLVSGNHDAASQITRHLVMPDNVTVFSVTEPETYHIPELSVAIHGQGFKERAVTANLVPEYPKSLPGFFNLGLLHTSVQGQGGHENYAPCRLDELIAKGYDYWALGHIHKRQILNQDPWIVYSGNLQGRHPGETGAKGAMLVTVDEGRVVRADFHALDVVRWFRCAIDISRAEDEQHLSSLVTTAITTIADANPDLALALRIELLGITALHEQFMADREYYQSEVENAAVIAAPARLWVEKVKFLTSPPIEPYASALTGDGLASLSETMAQLMADEPFLDAFAQEAAALQMRLAVYSKRDDATLIQSVQDVAKLLPDAKALISALIHRGGQSHEN